MDIVFISNQIKFDILNICGLPATHAYNLQTTTALNKMGYNSNTEFCRLLEHKLRAIAVEYNTGKFIAEGDVTENLTVRECIQLVIQ